jgi:glycosyltransferase involved in cell wall biosynthesis
VKPGGVKPRVLIVQPSLNPPGGAAGVAAWAIAALSPGYDVDLLTWSPIDLEAVNRYYGTRLDSSHFRILAGPARLKRLLDAIDPDPRSHQATALLMRAARLIGRGRRYAASLSFCNESDFGRPIIQYIHYPYMMGRFDDADRWWPLWGRDAREKVTRLRPWRVLSGFNPRRMRANLTLVNSEWTGSLVREAYGIEPITLYPPVMAGLAPARWDDRANVIISIGRLSSEKRWDVALDIVREVRARGYDVRWQLIGSPGGHASDGAYAERVRRAIAENRAWAELREEVSREELLRTIAQSRYGLHAMIGEHFGMAVSELAIGGCLVFVPDSGGQTEIVAHDPRLMYASPAEAVEKIVRVLRDDAARADLRASLSAHAERFSADHFQQQLRAIVAGHVSGRA